MYSLFIQCLATVLQKHLWTIHPSYLENHLSCDQYSTDVKVAFDHRLFETQRNSNAETFIFKLELHWSKGGQPFPPSKRSSQNAVKLFKNKQEWGLLNILSWGDLWEKFFIIILVRLCFATNTKLFRLQLAKGCFRQTPITKCVQYNSKIKTRTVGFR